MLLSLKSDTFKVVEGRQEDAEEFLTFLLNALNDEMLATFKVNTKEGSQDPAGSNSGEENPDDEADEWKEVLVGRKNKGVVTRRQHTLAVKTPIAKIFQGQIR